jgi:hypothetical protein
MMHEARQDHRRDMHEHERQGDVGDELMHPFHCLACFLAEHPGERSGLLVAAVDHKSGHHCRRDEYQKDHDHGAAAWAVAEVALPAKPDEIAHVTNCGGRVINEVGEARVARADEAPQDSRHDQEADQIAGPDMQVKQVALGEIGDVKASDQAPVKELRSGLSIRFCYLLGRALP